MQRPLVHVTRAGAHVRAIGRAAGWLACLCTAATALVAYAFPIPTLWGPSPIPASNVGDGVLIVGSIAGLGAAWTSIPRPLFVTFEQGPVEAASMSTAAGGADQGDDGAGPLDWQLEFVTIAGVAYNTGLGPGSATCGLAGGAQPCVAIYDGLLEAALAWAHEAHYLVN